MKYIISLLFLYLLTACSGGGGGPGGTTPSPTPPSGSSALTLSELSGYHFGIVNINSSKQKTFTITNSGTKASNALNLSIPSSPFSISSDTCTGSTLAINASCSFTVTYSSSSNGGHNTNISITGASSSVTFNVGGYTTTLDINSGTLFELNATADQALIMSDSSSGKFPTEPSDFYFDMGTQLFVSNVLALAKNNGILTGDIYTQTYGLNKTLSFLSSTDEGPGAVRAIDFLNDRNTLIPEWICPTTVNGSACTVPALAVKDIPSIFPLVHENITQNKPSPSSASSFTYADDFLDSRRINSSTSSMVAQYAYMFDENRWINTYGNTYFNAYKETLAHMQLKDLYLTLKTLKEYSKTTQLNQLSSAVAAGVALDNVDVNSFYGLNMSYSTNSFNHTAFTSASTKGLIDYMTVGDNITCKNNAYILLNLSYSLKYGTIDSSLASDAKSAIDFIWGELRTNWVDNNDSNILPDKINCLPMAVLAAFHTSRDKISNAKLNSMILQLETYLNNAATAQSENSFDPSRVNNPPGVLTLAEVVEAFTVLISH